MIRGIAIVVCLLQLGSMACALTDDAGAKVDVKKPDPDGNKLKWTTQTSAQVDAGIVYFGADRREYYASPLLDGAGNAIVRDGSPVSVVRERVQRQVVGTPGLTAVYHLALIPPQGHRLLWGPITGYGITFGTGLTESTANGLPKLTPFVGLSAFFGKDQDSALTLGVGWIPTKSLRGLNVGQQILSDTPAQDEVYSDPTLFLGLTMKLAGTKKGSDETPSNQTPSNQATSNQTPSNQAASGQKKTDVSVVINPFGIITLEPGEDVRLKADVTGAKDTAVSWAVIGSDSGIVTASGVYGIYIAPKKPGTYRVVAISNEDINKVAVVKVNVVEPLKPVKPSKP